MKKSHAEAPRRRAAVAYIRVSTAKQADEGDSLEAQVAAAKKFATDKGLTLVGHFSDAGKSGRTTKGRTALEQAIAKARATKGVLVVRSLSRLARSVIDLHQTVKLLEASGANLASINEAIDTTTAAGKAFFGFLAVMAAFESDLLAERTREAYQFRRSIGKPILAGVPKFGWKVVRGKLVVNLRAEPALKLIERMRNKGASFKEIADALNRRKLRTSDQLYGRKRPGIKRAKWWPGTVHRLVARIDRARRKR